MADVPAWMLVANTLVVGGFSLLPQYITPRAQREARRHEANGAAAAVMRDKAAEIFLEIASLERMFTAHLHAAAGNVEEAPDAISGLERLRGLVSTYYPEGLLIIEKHDQALQSAIQPARLAMVRALDEPLDHATGLFREMRMTLAFQRWDKLTEMTKELQRFLVDAVAPYRPQII